MAGFLQRVDDAINPIVVKELRQAVKSRFVVSVLLIFLVLQLGWIAMQLLFVGVQGRIDFWLSLAYRNLRLRHQLHEPSCLWLVILHHLVRGRWATAVRRINNITTVRRALTINRVRRGPFTLSL